MNSFFCNSFCISIEMRVLVIFNVNIRLEYFDHVRLYMAKDVQVTISYWAFANSMTIWDHANDVTRAQTSFKWIRGNKQLSTSFSLPKTTTVLIHSISLSSTITMGHKQSQSQMHLVMIGYGNNKANKMLVNESKNVMCLILSMMLDSIRTKTSWMKCWWNWLKRISLTTGNWRFVFGVLPIFLMHTLWITYFLCKKMLILARNGMSGLYFWLVFGMWIEKNKQFLQPQRHICTSSILDVFFLAIENSPLK